MGTPHQAILDIAYELYSKDNEITFNQFLDKIVEEEFEKYYEKTLWPKAQKEYLSRNKLDE
jgi:hypothetical protein